MTEVTLLLISLYEVLATCISDITKCILYIVVVSYGPLRYPMSHDSVIVIVVYSEIIVILI